MAKRKHPIKKLLTPKKAFALIRATSPEDVGLLDTLKREAHQNTSSGALMEAGRQYLRLKKENVQLHLQLSESIEREKRMKAVMQIIYHSTKVIEQYGKKHFKDAGIFPEPELF